MQILEIFEIIALPPTTTAAGAFCPAAFLTPRTVYRRLADAPNAVEREHTRRIAERFTCLFAPRRKPDGLPFALNQRRPGSRTVCLSLAESRTHGGKPDELPNGLPTVYRNEGGAVNCLLNRFFFTQNLPKTALYRLYSVVGGLYALQFVCALGALLAWLGGVARVRCGRFAPRGGAGGVAAFAWLAVGVARAVRCACPRPLPLWPIRSDEKSPATPTPPNGGEGASNE